jgi:hypothetical protein
MLIVGDVLVSEDILEKKFVCDLNACKGACCVQGDAGAPLSDEEPGILEEEYENFKAYIRPEGREAVKRDGVFTIDADGDLVTPLIDGKECAYTVFDSKGIAGCGIEQAWLAGKTSFRKPVSCHLYPVRVKKLVDIDALNYHTWDICKPACECGSKLQVPVYKFLKDALSRAYGEEWYFALEKVAEEWGKNPLAGD